jgi:prostaglandin-endoperoxide synthase 2
MFRIVTHRIAGFIFSNGWFWRLVQRVPGVREWINGVYISAVVNSTPPRPYPLSLWSPGATRANYHPPPLYRAPLQVTDYVSWTGLVDRGYTGRHLPPVAPTSNLPALDDLRELFARSKNAARQEVMLTSNTSALFCFFAQWFTDSFLRTDTTDARRNTSNHEIDLCQIYGLNAAQADILRSKVGGELTMRPSRCGDLLPFLYLQGGLPGEPAPLDPLYKDLPYAPGLDDLVKDLAGAWALDPPRRNLTYATGLERGNSTVFYTSISTMFAREHNRLARAMEKAQPGWDDDRLFALARNTNIVMLLRIIIEEYINHLSGAKFKVFVEHHYAERQRWYRTNRICLEFDLLYRWHSLPPAVVELDGAPLDQKDFRYNNALVENFGPESLIHAASHTRAGRIGVFNTPYFLLDADLATVSFGRMFQLAPFNDYRKHFGMAPYKSIAELAGDNRTTALLEKLYPGGVDDVELVVGLLAEDRYAGAPLGDLMRTMVGVDAFSQALTNPLLSENIFGEPAFGKLGIAAINETSRFADIVARNAASGARHDARFAVHGGLSARRRRSGR